MGRILAIDYGVKRTGLAVSDPLQIIAGALETVETKQLEKYIADYCSREEVTTIVVGKPSQMNGEKSETMRYIEPLDRKYYKLILEFGRFGVLYRISS